MGIADWFVSISIANGSRDATRIKSLLFQTFSKSPPPANKTLRHQDSASASASAKERRDSFINGQTSKYRFRVVVRIYLEAVSSPLSPAVPSITPDARSRVNCYEGKGEKNRLKRTIYSPLRLEKPVTWLLSKRVKRSRLGRHVPLETIPWNNSHPPARKPVLSP